MTMPGRWMIVAALLGLGAVCMRAARADDWTRPVEVTHDLKRCVSYRAKLSGPFLVIEATLGSGWHTFAMDNAKRAAEKLEGRKSLSQDLPTEINVTQGLELDGSWFQFPPKDFSRPDLRWFSWGFEGRALFVAKIRRSGTGPARIAVRGQVCTETTCRRVDIVISYPFAAKDTGSDHPDIDWKTLIQVR